MFNIYLSLRLTTYGLYLTSYIRPLFGFFKNLWHAKAFPRPIRSMAETLV